MNIQTFRGRDLRRLTLAAEAALGADAMIVRTTVLKTNPPQVEVVAASGEDMERLRRRIEPTPLRNPAGSSLGRPLTIALAGPTGAGKTTTLAKLAASQVAFGGWKVGLVTIDTFRTGALEQLESFAQAMSLPLEVVYSPEEVDAAMERLERCNVILVDSPGRSPRHPEHNRAWTELLAKIAPDEIHLVIPAPMRLDVAVATLDAYEGLGISHLLITKLDEVPNDVGVADAAIEMRLPTRWITDGQEIPLDLHPAVPRILQSVGSYTGGLSAMRISA